MVLYSRVHKADAEEEIAFWPNKFPRNCKWAFCHMETFFGVMPLVFFFRVREIGITMFHQHVVGPMWLAAFLSSTVFNVDNQSPFFQGYLCLGWEERPSRSQVKIVENP